MELEVKMSLVNAKDTIPANARNLMKMVLQKMAARREMNVKTGTPLIYAASLLTKTNVQDQIVGSSTIKTVPQQETMMTIISTIF